MVNKTDPNYNEKIRIIEDLIEHYPELKKDKNVLNNIFFDRTDKPNKFILDRIQINNKVLELKSEIIKINSICETLELSKICIIFNYNKLANNTYIFLIIIILIDIILFIICLNYNPNDIYNLQIKIYLLLF